MTVTLNTAFVLGLIVSWFIPLVSALLTRANWSPQATGILTALLAAVNGFCVEWSNSPSFNHYNWQQAAVVAIGSFVTAVAAHIGVWKSGAAERSLLAFPGRPAGQHEQAAA